MSKRKAINVSWKWNLVQPLWDRFQHAASYLWVLSTWSHYLQFPFYISLLYISLFLTHKRNGEKLSLYVFPLLDHEFLSGHCFKFLATRNGFEFGSYLLNKVDGWNSMGKLNEIKYWFCKIRSYISLLHYLNILVLFSFCLLKQNFTM